MKRLQDKIAIITGGSSGLGEATALRFVEEGAKVVIFDVKQTEGEALIESIRAKGGSALFVQVDVSNEDDVARGIQATLDAWQTIDILVNNAAITGVNKLAHEVDVADWDKIFAINVRGGFLCTKHVIPTMMARRTGAIVNFSSIYGLIGNVDIPPYHSTKGAVLMMTKTDAISYAPYGIRVNSVHPGSVKTALFHAAARSHPGGADAYIAMMNEKHPLRLGEPVDVANCVLFLASEEARFVTGTSLVCDGGYTAQ